VKLDDAQLFGQSRTLRIKQLLGLDGSTGSLRSRRSRRYSDALIFIAFRGPQAQVNQLRKSSSAASHSFRIRLHSWLSVCPRRLRNASFQSALAEPSPAFAVRAPASFGRQASPTSHLLKRSVHPGTRELETALLPRIPLRRLGVPDDAADVLVFFCSQQARWITGQRIFVGGGHQMM
jgi:Enoyl-(Acyl carrier protein) reductase